MALKGQAGLSCCCQQPYPGNLVHGSAPTPCSTCIDQFQVDHKAEPPSGGEEWQCDTCQLVYPGRTPIYRQDSKLLCEACRPNSEYEFAETSYMHHQAPTRYYGRRGQSRQVASPFGVNRKPSVLPKVHRPSAQFRGMCVRVWVTINKHNTQGDKLPQTYTTLSYKATKHFSLVMIVY